MLILSRRNRGIPVGQSPYVVLPDTVNCLESSLEADVYNKRTQVTLVLSLDILENNTVRFKINERDPLRPRFQVQDVLVGEPKTVV